MIGDKLDALQAVAERNGAKIDKVEKKADELRDAHLKARGAWALVAAAAVVLSAILGILSIMSMIRGG
jgi:hypothetical protein